MNLNLLNAFETFHINIYGMRKMLYEKNKIEMLNDSKKYFK